MRNTSLFTQTDDQKLNLQQEALRTAGCEQIFEDYFSGVKTARPGLTSALETARAEDTLVVWRLDRLGRSLKDLIELTETLKGRSIGLHSLLESINTTSSSGQLVFHLFGALASKLSGGSFPGNVALEFERNLIRERTQAGLAAARARGRKGGRPKALDPNKRQLAVKLYNDRQYS